MELRPARSKSRATYSKFRLISQPQCGAEAQDVAIVTSASYGIAAAGLNLPPERGARVLLVGAGRR